MTPGVTVTIDYTNWRGERRKRQIVPLALDYNIRPPYYTTYQWLLTARDVEKNYALRTFAMRNIHSWEPVE